MEVGVGAEDTDNDAPPPRELAPDGRVAVFPCRLFLPVPPRLSYRFISTISPFMAPSAVSNSFCSGIGTLNFAKVALR